MWDVRRGALAAVLDLVKTALAIQDLKNTLDTLPFAVVTEVMGIEVPGLSLEKVDDLRNMAYGAVAALQDPPRVLAALGQKIGDTVEEEGIAYSISYVAADVAIQVLLSKGLGEVKNVSKADDLVDVARTVDTLDDTVKIADELTDAAKVVDQVGDIADAAMAVNVMDEANAAVKAVDKVDEAADVVKVVERLDDVVAGGTEVKYSPVNPGPLSEDVANSFNGATYTERILTEDTIMYRVSGGNAKKVGSYISMTPQGGGLQSQLDLALNPAWGNTTENVTKVVVPKGTTIYEGVAMPQNIYDSLGNVTGTLLGGGNQVYIPRVEARWFQ